MDKKKETVVLTDAQQKQIIKEVKHTFECEKMPLTEQDIKNGKDILQGKKTGNQVVAEELERMKNEGLIK